MWKHGKSNTIHKLPLSKSLTHNQSFSPENWSVAGEMKLYSQSMVTKTGMTLLNRCIEYWIWTSDKVVFQILKETQYIFGLHLYKFNIPFLEVQLVFRKVHLRNVVLYIKWLSGIQFICRILFMNVSLLFFLHMLKKKKKKASF